MYEIIAGRDAEDRKKLGTKATFLLGRHYVTMGQTTSLSNEILMDAAKSHVVFITGKRGSGKSYSAAAIAEGMMTLPYEVKSKLSIIMFDTMGIYWTMKYENKQDAQLLREWNLKYEPLNVKIYFPEGYYQQAKEKGLPIDSPFSIKPSELSAADWCNAFNIELTTPIGSLIGRVIANLKEKNDYEIEDIAAAIQADERTDEYTKSAAENIFATAASWGLFGRKCIPISEIMAPGQITVIDVSSYASSVNKTSVRALVIGILCRQIFLKRMQARQAEEYRNVKTFTRLVREEEEQKEVPLIWIMVDEAHEFAGRHGTTAATDALLTLLREGRQPGISLVLASQQPGQIHTDVMTQSDIVIAHHITAKIDTDALAALMQSYMREGLDAALSKLPDEKGAAILFDDTNERLYPMRVRPRITWHGGGSPSIVTENKSSLGI